ncbi:cora-like Mg2+ transporter protein-domain-containing protein [Rhodocollybia butyracea]|uniref:Cora-like Mg2+ transporter protein-domain-containing protein n=1 Tax=Rhodocollybia butyracea TaxID=206335 RepID=A0A9P5UG07_9AGAR|nr:cora-like Mg2+ transporter protein-domain-containing protein [Rhodocollybia butyracea]
MGYEPPKTVAPPPHRHAAPSAPWPWMDIHDAVDLKQLESPSLPIPVKCLHHNCNRCYTGYPQSRFPNWTPAQVKRSGINTAIHDYDKNRACTIHYVNVDTHGLFTDAEKRNIGDRDEEQLQFWGDIAHETRPDTLRVRALFVENMTGPVLQMIGTKYNIEPFFFSSSLSSIPSRFQEEVRSRKGDHITITLSFLRAVRLNTYVSSSASMTTEFEESDEQSHSLNTQVPLRIRIGPEKQEYKLVLDLLSVHLIRSNDGVYWQSIFQKSPDPTFVLLVFIWHAMYAWDEALEKLYSYICLMESQIMRSSEMTLTRDLHTIQAHQLHYSSLLEDFRKSVEFILNTPNPAMDARKLLEKECLNLLIEVERLEKSREMQERRLKNVMNLVFSTVNITDSKRMQDLTQAAMKQIAYLSMVFLPASFVAGVFGMNVQELSTQTNGTLETYFAAAFPLTAVTIWIVIAFQSRHLKLFKDRGGKLAVNEHDG